MIYVVFIIIFLLTVILTVRIHYARQIKRAVYLYIDFFIRHMHDHLFYGDSSKKVMESLYDTVKKIRSLKDKWYLSNDSKHFLMVSCISTDMVDYFYHWMADKMTPDHYFSFPELLKSREILRTDLLKEMVHDDFLHVVNRYEPSSLSTCKEYLNLLDWDMTETVNKHNSIFVRKELEENKEFFDTVMKYPLDDQQRESIVKLEYNTLVISSAGSGKTTTTVSKIKYLVEKKGILPHKILPLTYTRKAAGELSDRLGYRDKGMVCHTFHSLAFDIIRKAGGAKPDMCPEGAMLQSFYHQSTMNPLFKKAVNIYLTRWASLTQNCHDYNNAADYFRDRALYGIQAPFLDIDGRIIFTRSEEEKKICTFLSLNGVPFRYERPFPYRTDNREHRQYIPDFTIYIKKNGKWSFLILEHWGIDKNGNVPQWFGAHKPGGWVSANNKYRDGIHWKRTITARYGIQLIETTSAMFHDGTIFTYLKEKLQSHGVELKPISEEEKFERLVVRNKRAEDSIVRLISTFITLMKAGDSTFDGLLDTIRAKKNVSRLFVQRCEFMIELIFKPVYEDYCQYLHENKKIDYTDLIIQATELCRTRKYVPDYDYILIDEFQDISADRFRMLQALRRDDQTTKLYCVGDDWQSIFRFSGSDLSLFSDFDRFFGFSEKCRIETTYRFGNPLISVSSEFILANEMQIPKHIRAKDKDKKTDIRFYSFRDGETWQILSDILEQIPESESIMLVGRYNSDSDFIPAAMVADRDERKRPVSFKWGKRTIPYNTVHSAKGLEADHVILVNCSQDGNGFPSRICDDPILGYVLSKAETFPFAEERRLFYVAITRARKRTHVMYKETCPSPFVTEINKDAGNNNVLKCPVCQAGQLRMTKEGSNGMSRWRLYHCSNTSAGCDYGWFVDFHDEKEISSRFEVECVNIVKSSENKL